jgi:hypothetical protein
MFSDAETEVETMSFDSYELSPKKIMQPNLLEKREPYQET